jgi:ribosomal protein S6--L-glutamate ligase
MVKSNTQNKIKQIIIISESPDLYTTKRLLHEATKQKIAANYVNPYKNTLVFKNKDSFENNLSSVCFHRTTGIRYDDQDLTLSRYYKYLGHQISNPIEHLEKFRNKDTQSIFFIEHNFSSIPTISTRGNVDNDNLEKFFSISKNQKYILKMNRGNQGIGVNFINGNKSLQSILETFSALNDQKFIIQPYIEQKTELRVFIIKNKIIAIIEKTINKNEFRGNSKRSKAKVIKELPKNIIDEVIRISKLSQLDYCGIDILITGKKYYFLEVNAVPGFKQIEELSSINIAKELILALN